MTGYNKRDKQGGRVGCEEKNTREVGYLYSQSPGNERVWLIFSFPPLFTIRKSHEKLRAAHISGDGDDTRTSVNGQLGIQGQTICESRRRVPSFRAQG